MKTPLPVSEVRSLIDPRCFFRYAQSEDALWVTDAPRRLTGAETDTLIRTLAAQGFPARLTQRALLEIDLDDDRWQALLTATWRCGAGSLPGDERLHEVYALARLLAAHPCTWASQPRNPWRALLKRCDRLDAMLVIAPSLLADCAVRLRKRESLPASAAGFLFEWLMDAAGEEAV